MSMNLGSNMGVSAPSYPAKNSDPQNPASYLNSAYQAYKFNPGATQQALQAAGQAQQQGQPTDLRGLAALAAAHSQQFAKQAQQSAQAQGMPPSVLQQILQSSGIMNQLQPQQALAQQPPEGQGLGALQPEAASLPDAGGMATGGLVALARGGTSSLDDDEVDSDEFWDENYSAGPDIGGFLKRHAPSRETLHRLGIDIETPKPFNFSKETPEQYYETTTPSPSKARELAGEKPPQETPDPVNLDTTSRNAQLRNLWFLNGDDTPDDRPATPSAPPVKQKSNPPPPPTPEIPAAHADVKGTDEHGHIKSATAEVNPKATKIAKELQPTVIQDNSTVPNQNVTTSATNNEIGAAVTELRAKIASLDPVRDKEAYDQVQAQLVIAQKRQDEAEMAAAEGNPAIHPAAHQEGIASLAPGESMGVPDRRPRGFAPDAEPTGIEGQLAQLEAMRGTYQMPPEIMEQLKNNVSSAKEDKWLMALTGLGAGFLGSNSPFKTQALGQGLMTGLGMYGRGAGEEEQAKSQMLAAQMAQAKAPYEAHTQAVNDLIRMQESRGKLMAGLKEKQFEYGMKDKLNQDRIRSNQQIADKRLEARGDKGDGRLTESQLLHATSEAEKARKDAIDAAISAFGSGVRTSADNERIRQIGEAAFRRRLGPYYDQIMASSGSGGSFASGPVAQGNSQTRGFVVPGKFTPIGQ